MNWGFLIINLIMATALFLEMIEMHRDANLENLSPPSAGITTSSGINRGAATPAQALTRQGVCDDIVFRISQDNVKYVREAGGGRLFAAIINSKFGLYQLDSYGHMIEVDNYRTHADAVQKLRYALQNCTEVYYPAGTYFPRETVKHAGNGATPAKKAGLE